MFYKGGNTEGLLVPVDHKFLSAILYHIELEETKQMSYETLLNPYNYMVY